VSVAALSAPHLLSYLPFLRILLQRNYHIFYQLIAGADSAMKKRLHLKPPAEYSYLNQSGTSCCDAA
jgi:myosin heavy subunit